MTSRSRSVKRSRSSSTWAISIVPAKASRTNPASRGEKTASPAATRPIASTSSGPEMFFVTYPRAPARMIPMTSSAASLTDSAS